MGGCDDARVRSGRAQGVARAPRYIGRDRSQAWWLLILPAVIVGLWAALQLVKASVPLPDQVLIAVLAAVIAVVVPQVHAGRKQDDERRQVMATHLRRLTAEALDDFLRNAAARVLRLVG